MFRLLAIYFLVVNKIIITNAEITPEVVAPSSGQAVNATTVPGPEADTYTPEVVPPTVDDVSEGQGCDHTNGNTYTSDECNCGRDHICSDGHYCLEYGNHGMYGYCFGKDASNNIEAWKDAYNTFACLDRQDHPVAQILKSKWENANQC